MPTMTGIDPGTGTIAAQPPRQARGVNSLRSEDFFKLLVTELQQQDPLEPTKTGDMIGQVSQIRSIEQNERLNAALQRMSDQQRTTGSTELLNKYVVAQTTDGAGNTVNAEGVVTGVRFASDGAALLDLDNGQTIRAQDVRTVTTVEQMQATASPATTDRAQVEGDVAQSAAGLTKKRDPWFKILSDG